MDTSSQEQTKQLHINLTAYLKFYSACLLSDGYFGWLYQDLGQKPPCTCVCMSYATFL